MQTRSKPNEYSISVPSVGGIPIHVRKYTQRPNRVNGQDIKNAFEMETQLEKNGKQ